MNKVYYILCCFLLLYACQSDKLYYSTQKQDYPAIQKEDVDYSLFLIGDVGADTLQSSPALRILNNQLSGSVSDKTGVVFLGDNIYPEGLHKKKHELRKEDEVRLDIQLDAVKSFKGEVVFIPGNHDWQQGGKKGVHYVKRQEDYIEKKLGRKVFKPSNGCSGPEEIELSDNLTLIVIDTQWWLHKYEKSRGEKDHCDFRTKEVFLTEFKELLKTNREKNVIVVGHHPLYSNGVHGGYFGVKDHLFPLTKLNPNWWVPLPVIGSIYPFYRSFFGNIQDIAHPKYQELKRELVAAMGEYDNVMYAAGHEHNLQYTKENRLHHIVSGAGAKKSGLRFNKKIEFGAEHRGFVKLDVLKDGEVFLSFISAENKTSQLLFRKKIFEKGQRKFNTTAGDNKPSYKGLYQTVVPDSTFEANGLKRVFFGDLNRDLWTLPIQVPYLDLHYEKGGLTPVGKGGGMQTLSLKMKGGDGNIYKLRGIKKNADFLVTRDLRNTITQDIIYDGIAGSHPYASVAIPKLAQAADIYYTKPLLVYLPKDSILGDYLEEFGGMFCLMEMHASGDMSDYKHLGNSTKVINYHKAIKKIEEHPKNTIDVNFTVRSRLFDFFIGDWDRHDDQWRWATFKQEDKTIFRPIPRDRDQAFFQFDGIIMRLASSKWLLRKFQSFKEDVRDIEGLGFNARYFDRYFLNQADLDIWKEEAERLQQLLTDEALEEGLKELPKEAYQYNGEEILEVLKKRRNKLEKFASDYYLTLAKEVDVRGSMEEDFFEVIRQKNGNVEVNIYHKKKKGKRRYYHRVFKKSETKEIRIYGIDDKDEYLISGSAKKSILVRIIASENKDEIKDVSHVNGLRKMTKVYDMEGKSELELGREAKLIVQPIEEAYLFNRKEFQHDVFIPIPSIGSNPDDGFYIGPRVKYIKRGFKKDPYKYYHDVYANYTFGAEGINLRYKNEYTKLLGKFNWGNEIELNRPEVFQFYGEGNETELTNEEIGRAGVRINYFNTTTNFSLLSKNQASKLTASFGYQIARPEENRNLGVSTANQQFLSNEIAFLYKNVDNEANPTKGAKFELKARQTNSLINEDVNFLRFSSNLSFYVPVNYFKKQTTLALRAGAMINEGDYAFYQANFLSGLNEFRGVTRNRFAGEGVFYTNVELRKSFLQVTNYVAPFDFGMVLHYDMGRVWVENEQSDLWHRSFGGGIYLGISNFVTLVGSYSISDVDEVFNLGTKFYF